MKNLLFKLGALFTLLLTIIGCVEEIRFDNETFENVLIIDATLTDEEKYHHIYINRAHRFNEDGPNRVSGATVQILTHTETYTFEEEAAGIYTSVQRFKASPNTTYKLQITTQNGSVYTSTGMALTTATAIDNLYARRDTNDDGVNGMSIYVDSYDPSNTSKFYRYEFEETFKIVAPFWRNQDLYIVDDVYPNCILGLTPRSEDKIICYRTEASNFINLATTSTLAEDRVSEHLVRFLSSESYKISYRYSILVTQYVQTEQAYNYFKTLGSFSDEGSLFSQLQTGYIAGNITSENNSSEKIVGFFEVAAVARERLFLNYTDFYPDEALPPYVVPCTTSAPELYDISHNYMCGAVMNIIRNNALVYLKENTGQFPRGGPFVMVPRSCGDCTALGETTSPEFWVE
ncbi:DUF4249 domain-containing protein [Rasiella rasia]|uniref:DUF4249 domain-containing protein n=1 Tax=Rasiella rasia TaxID=2744027 RepID=A0A6G6GI35_9FLAO|nr:DUF4249 domain-containing protein [Rasiella rasia]QIE58209.1 DUF4249 domain-containing protein [Rasiella rasia]